MTDDLNRPSPFLGLLVLWDESSKYPPDPEKEKARDEAILTEARNRAALQQDPRYQQAWDALVELYAEYGLTVDEFDD